MTAPYGHIFSSTVTSITRAVVQENHVVLQTLKVTDEVALTWEELRSLAGYVAAEALGPRDPVEEDPRRNGPEENHRIADEKPWPSDDAFSWEFARWRASMHSQEDATP